ncbi:MAG TPA: hypothetical protein VMS08_01160 [Candidatus Saccharimonadia bacterium]|nr:hypothetical protein [Candidatus Saccharimonadia bacterium]
MKSFSSNVHDYEPDCWELQYENRRYLAGMESDQLAKRYVAIVRNFRVFVRPECDVVPIHCYFGSWYWYRKEHQSRYEFFQRNLDPPCAPPTQVVSVPDVPAISSQRFPDAKIIFRYGNSDAMRKSFSGSVRITAAPIYDSSEMNEARSDDELNKHTFLPALYTTLRTADGQNIELMSDIRRTSSSPDYYILCASCEWSDELFQAFNADTCLVIRKPEIFADRLSSAAAAVAELKGWYFHHGPVHYFDPYEWKLDDPFLAPNSKDFRFAYQREYRFLWNPLRLNVSAVAIRTLQLGPLNDIAELYDASGTRLA